ASETEAPVRRPCRDGRRRRRCHVSAGRASGPRHAARGRDGRYPRMLENELTNEPNSEETADTAVAPRRRRRAASRPAGPPQGPETADAAPEIVLTPAAEPGEETEEAESPEVPEAGVVLVDAQPRRARRRATAPVASPAPTPTAEDAEGPLTEPGAEDASACAVV